MTETLEVNILPNAPPVHSKLTDTTYPTVFITAEALCIDNVTLQLGPMVVLFDTLRVTWKSLLLVGIPSGLQLLVGDTKCTSDCWTGTLFRTPLATEVQLNLTKL